MDRMRTGMDKMTIAVQGTMVSQLFRTPSRAEHSLRFWVDRIGEKTDSGMPERLRVLGLYAVVGVSTGSGVYEDSLGRTRAVAAGDCMLLFPSVASRYGSPQGPWNTFWVVWGGELASAFQSLGIVDPDFPVVRDRDGAAREAFERLGPLMAQGDPQACLCRLSLVTDLLARLHSQRLHPARSPMSQELVSRVAAYLDTRFLEHTPPSAIAHRFAISHSHLRRLFRAAMGQSMKEYVTGKRLSLAKQLLSEGGRTVKEVAAAAGYDDPCYFMRVFRRKVGVSAGRFR